MADELQVRFTSDSVGAYLRRADPTWQASTRFSPRARLTLGNFELNVRGEGSVTNVDRTPIGSRFWDAQPSSSLARDSYLSFWEHQPNNEKDSIQGNLGLRQLTLGIHPIPDFYMLFGIHRWDRPNLEDAAMEGLYSPPYKFAFSSFPIGLFGGEVGYDRERTKTISENSAEKENNKKRKTRIYTNFRMAHVGKLGKESRLFLMSQAGGEITTPHGLSLGNSVYFGAHENVAGNTPLFDPGWSLVTGVGIWGKFKGFRLLGAYSYRTRKFKDELALPAGEQRSSLSLSPSYDWKAAKGAFRLQGTAAFLARKDWESSLKEEEIIEHTTTRGETDLELSVSYETPRFWGKSFLTFTLGYHGTLVRKENGQNTHGVFLGIRTDLSTIIPVKIKKD